MRLVLATKNPGKLKEMKTLAQISNLDWISLELAPSDFDPEEIGSTFAQNALIKAKAAAALTHRYALADDSGICVDALNGRPGVYSSRYSEGNEEKGCLKLLDELKDTPTDKRTASYHCIMSLVSPDGEFLFEGTGIWHGYITNKMIGTGGFGYDPIFYLDTHKQTVAQISLAEKNKLSHRAQAWQQITNYLNKQKKYFHN